LCSGSDVSCFGGNNGSAAAAVSGGTPDYSYNWSNGANTSSISSLMAGTYSVTVTDDHSCTTTCSYEVTQPAAALTATCSGSDVSCFGGNNGSAAAAVSGGTPDYSYNWSNGANTSSISSLMAGTYSVTVTDDHSCTTTCSYEVTQPAAALTALCSGSDVSCFGGNNGTASAAVSGGTPDYSYTWSNGANTSSISPLTAGTYSVTVTDDHSCTTTCSYEV